MTDILPVHPRVIRASIRPPRREHRWFLRKMIPDAPMTVVYGAPASLKSFLVLDWMLHADRGMPWYGHDIAPGRCLYVPGEGAVGMHDRIDAWCLYNEVPRQTLDSLISERINLYQPDHDQLAAVIEQARAEGPVRYVVFDTLHSLSTGADENSASDFGRVLSTMQYIQDALGEGHDVPTRAFLVHHTNKEGKAIRGTSAILGSCDNQFRLKRASIHSPNATLMADKVKDAAEPANMNITFDVQYTGEKDDEGESITSLVTTDARYTGAQDSVSIFNGMRKADVIRQYKREHPEATQTEIALATGSTQPTVSKALKGYNFEDI